MIKVPDPVPLPSGPALNAVAREAVAAARHRLQRLRAVVAQRVTRDGRVDRALMDHDQRLVHGLAWAGTLTASLDATAAWHETALAAGRAGADEDRLLLIGFAEYLGQLAHGIVMGQNEIVRDAEYGPEAGGAEFAADPAVAWFLGCDLRATRAALAASLAEGGQVADTLHDELLDQFRRELNRFATDRILPVAHHLHLRDELVPQALLDEMAALGVFGLCIGEEHGGLGLGKLAMAVVTEELSRAWIAAGSLGTRAEIAGELISHGGTEAQKARYLPEIAAGRCLPAAVFTEPDTGSDLGAVSTRAMRSAEGSWQIQGAKTWITHAARSDLMTVLVRTDPESRDHNGLSILLAEKPRGSEADPFPAEGMTGSEIGVLGYRGMREYALSFDGFTVPAEGLLGGVEARGFRQLMQTFEGARIQTAARAVGVARRALELALAYATDRRQFGQALIGFPRVSDKIAIMATETVMAREMTYAAARQKDGGRRCDIEAGMAKLIAARVAWSAADASLQIHGGNGYALEFEASRILVDARILNIFEGAAEIQAQIIARGLLSGGGNAV
ncbi:acyl-CoA dehydrogenase family protein [Pseudogemmobacter humi]|uniref:Acyl-CoA dehydrogenase n=1 Tax=Pseudogemmobacter humi TaxID=2483812 RepID=A0A3P5WVY4_9RHOB|nr:acyl-CoA dehydrogenase family protein [Pseudogemmobacter humi]VDC22656.1 Acyl-CoA dehydrogenase [Pseudogemmobacter humi]